MAKKKSNAFPWSKAGSAEIKKFTDYVEHCRHFAESIARRKEHPAVTDEDVADAIQEYAALWAGQRSKPAESTKPAVPKKKKGLRRHWMRPLNSASPNWKALSGKKGRLAILVLAIRKHELLTGNMKSRC